jgi:hypothetical protein
MPMSVRFCDELDVGFGWAPAEPERLARTSHALVAAGRVWVIDPIDGDGVEERVRALGEPAGVLQLLDRHRRDCAAFAERLGVPLLETSFDDIPGSPFEVLPVLRRRRWREVALWWPEQRVLVCAEVLGTTWFFLARGERLGVHPLLRLSPPDMFRNLVPEHVLCGHGEGVHGPEAAVALEEALRTSRRRLPRVILRI